MTAATATSKELGTGVLLRDGDDRDSGDRGGDDRGSGDRGAAAVAHRAWLPGHAVGDTPIDGLLRPGYPLHMSTRAQTILEQALRLSADERAHLADALQRSFEDGASGLPPDEVTRLWNDEIDRRLARACERVARGEPLGRSADEVCADAEARIARR
jgi:Putative addiction module component